MVYFGRNVEKGKGIVARRRRLGAPELLLSYESRVCCVVRQPANNLSLIAVIVAGINGNVFLVTSTRVV